MGFYILPASHLGGDPERGFPDIIGIAVCASVDDRFRQFDIPGGKRFFQIRIHLFIRDVVVVFRQPHIQLPAAFEGALRFKLLIEFTYHRQIIKIICVPFLKLFIGQIPQLKELDRMGIFRMDQVVYLFRVDRIFPQAFPCEFIIKISQSVEFIRFDIIIRLIA